MEDPDSIYRKDRGTCFINEIADTAYITSIARDVDTGLIEQIRVSLGHLDFFFFLFIFKAFLLRSYIGLRPDKSGKSDTSKD